MLATLKYAFSQKKALLSRSPTRKVDEIIMIGDVEAVLIASMLHTLNIRNQKKGSEGKETNKYSFDAGDVHA